MNRPAAAALAAVVSLCACTPAAEVLQATASQPRAFGWRVGDVVERDVLLEVPAPWELDTESLPRGGGHGRSLELHDLQLERHGERLRLVLRYQVMRSPPQVRTLEIAPMSLRFRGGGQERELRVPAWPVTVAPLVPEDVAERTGLGDLRPDRPPPHVDASGPRLRLLLWGAAALAAAAVLAQVYVGLPWLARRRRPLSRAWAELRSLPADADAAAGRRACACLHDALNRSAGVVLFEAGLDDYVARHPRMAPLADELRTFFRDSRRLFFESDAGRVDGRRLRELSRRLRDAERGSGGP